MSVHSIDTKETIEPKDPTVPVDEVLELSKGQYCDLLAIGSSPTGELKVTYANLSVPEMFYMIEVLRDQVRQHMYEGYEEE